ncbi:uncharacterized protein LOC118511974 isoform X2 [Anopheles stephensi]|uniref:uncharacterized protein LOC118511974 isoform X2 n=1 Tax=Anopheles stephensi TaxID=30069 RepID=UPI00165874B6|nr:uncharacterized protein LOC118511974 isoform X2 [Anopheles stephensi]
MLLQHRLKQQPVQYLHDCYHQTVLKQLQPKQQPVQYLHDCYHQTVLKQLQPKQQPHSTILCSSIHVKYIDQHPPLKSRHHPSSMQLLRKKNEMC